VAPTLCCSYRWRSAVLHEPENHRFAKGVFICGSSPFLCFGFLRPKETSHSGTTPTSDPYVGLASQASGRLFTDLESQSLVMTHHRVLPSTDTTEIIDWSGYCADPFDQQTPCARCHAPRCYRFSRSVHAPERVRCLSVGRRIQLRPAKADSFPSCATHPSDRRSGPSLLRSGKSLVGGTNIAGRGRFFQREQAEYNISKGTGSSSMYAGDP